MNKITSEERYVNKTGNATLIIFLRSKCTMNFIIFLFVFNI